MDHLWEPQQTVDAPLALELIQEQFPELEPINIRILGVGWDNSAFVINDKWIFRFPRREIALPLLEAEWCALPKLAPHLPLPIPLPKWRGAPTSRFTWPFIGYERLPGFTACYVNLTEEERGALAEPIARFLSHLHTAPHAVLSECQIPGDNLSRIDWKCMIPKILKNIEELSLLNLLENRKRLESVIDGLRDLRAPVQSAIVHGDFYVRHLLVDKSHKLVGIIDWGDIHIGDPAIDLAIAHSFLPVQAQAKFREAYGEISSATWSLALLRALYSSSFLVLYGYHSKEPDLLREGLRLLNSEFRR